MRGRSRQRRSGSPKRTREWTDHHTFVGSFPNTATGISLAPGQRFQTWVLNPDEVVEFMDEPTLVRGIFRWFSWAVSATPIAYQTALYWGLIKVKSNGAIPFTTPSDCPSPINDGDDEWIWQTNVYGQNRLTGVLAQLTQAFADKVGFEDVRTKRKFGTGDGLALIVESAADNTIGSSHMFTWSGRLLWLNN